jgi:hypothetical protein
VSDYAAYGWRFSEHEEEIVSLVRAEAHDVLAAGKATLEVTPSDGWHLAPTMCGLRPGDEAACPFTAQIDSAEQVTLYLGRYRTICKLYNTDRRELLDEIGEYLRSCWPVATENPSAYGMASLRRPEACWRLAPPRFGFQLEPLNDRPKGAMAEALVRGVLSEVANGESLDYGSNRGPRLDVR